jgi:hypothetical protein
MLRGGWTGADADAAGKRCCPAAEASVLFTAEVAVAGVVRDRCSELEMVKWPMCGVVAAQHRRRCPAAAAPVARAPAGDVRRARPIDHVDTPCRSELPGAIALPGRARAQNQRPHAAAKPFDLLSSGREEGVGGRTSSSTNGAKQVPLAGPPAGMSESAAATPAAAGKLLPACHLLPAVTCYQLPACSACAACSACCLLPAVYCLPAACLLPSI